jgi:hypothetical protein
LARATKCRAADDLLLAAENHPAYKRERLELTFKTNRELMRITTSAAPLAIRALALWYAIGTNRRPSPRLRARRGDPAAAFDALCEAGLPHTVVEVAREGFCRTGEVLCPFVALLCPLKSDEATVTADDEFPPEIMIRSVPSWAFDMYSREGRAALQLFLQGSGDTARWVRDYIPRSARVNFLGTLVFRVEGGLVRQRLRWATGDELRRLVDFECNGPHCPDASEVLQLLRKEIALLNEVRAHVC